MVRITISDLHPIGEQKQLDELTDWEMKTVEGGSVRGKRGRRTRRGSRNSASDPSGIVSGLNERFDNWLDLLDTQLGDMQTEIIDSI